MFKVNTFAVFNDYVDKALLYLTHHEFIVLIYMMRYLDVRRGFPISERILIQQMAHGYTHYTESYNGCGLTVQEVEIAYNSLYHFGFVGYDNGIEMQSPNWGQLAAERGGK